MRHQDLPVFVDSGNPGDPLHLVQLRGAPAGRERGRIRGALPDHFVLDGVVYFRSGFTQREPDGELQYSYYPVRPRFRPYRGPAGSA